MTDNLFTQGDLAQLEREIEHWKDTINWIAKGWDCIEEYTNDLCYRDELQDVLDEFEQNALPIPDTLRSRLAEADRRFISCTEDSDLCVWHAGPLFRAYGEHAELIVETYDKTRQWYFYRWQPDCPYSFRGHDMYSYQLAVYGMDFRNDSEAVLEAKAAALGKQWVEEWRKLRGDK